MHPLAVSRDTTIEQILQDVTSGAWDPSPPYQRTATAWIPAQQHCFIESVLMGLPIMPMCVAPAPIPAGDRRKRRWEVVDGQQRITALQAFVGNLWAIRSMEYKTEYENHRFDQLPTEVQERFLATQIRIYQLQVGEPFTNARELAQAMFDRMNRGAAFTRAERLHSSFQSPRGQRLLELGQQALGQGRRLQEVILVGAVIVALLAEAVRTTRKADLILPSGARYHLGHNGASDDNQVTRFDRAALTYLDNLDDVTFDTFWERFEDTFVALLQTFGRGVGRRGRTGTHQTFGALFLQTWFCRYYAGAPDMRTHVAESWWERLDDDMGVSFTQHGSLPKLAERAYRDIRDAEIPVITDADRAAIREAHAGGTPIPVLAARYQLGVGVILSILGEART